jgi:hypothetical protein
MKRGLHLSWWRDETFHVGELSMIFIQGEELRNSLLKCRGDVEGVNQTMTRCQSMGTDQSLSPSMYG